MALRLSFLLFTLININLFFSQEKTNELTLNINGTPTSIEIDNQNKERKTAISETYFWYKSNKIIQTTGGYQGQLLHGRYIESYSNGQLKLKGFFRYGQQFGQWKYWNENGKLQRLENWKNNKLNGKVYYFKESGEVEVIKSFRKGILKTKTT